MLSSQTAIQQTVEALNSLLDQDPTKYIKCIWILHNAVLLHWLMQVLPDLCSRNSHCRNEDRISLKPSISCGPAQMYLTVVQLHFVRIDNHEECSLFQARVS